MARKVRQVRLGEVEPVKTQTARTAVQLVALASLKETDLVVLAENMTMTEAQLLIDLATDEDVKAKAAKKIVDAGKKLLMAHARGNKWKTMASKKAVAKISSGTSTQINPLALLKKLRKLGKKHLFESLFKVAITPAKQYLGADEIEDIAEVTTSEYGAMSLKKLRK